MLNISVEQIIKVNQPVSAKVFKVVMIILCVLSALLIPQTYGIGVILLALIVLFTILLFKYYNSEYEYSLVENELTVDKIMARSMRKRCGVYNISKAELIAPVKSQEAMRLEHRKLRILNYSSGSESDNIYVAYLLDNNNEMVKLILEPNEKMKDALKKVIPKKFY